MRITPKSGPAISSIKAEPKVGAETKTPEPKAADDFVYIAIGDSLTSGMQDATLDLNLQRKSFPALVSEQAGIRYQPPEIHGGSIPPRIFEPKEIPLGRTAWRAAQVAAASVLPLALAKFGFNPPGWSLYPLYFAGGVGHQAGSDDITNFAVPGFELRHLAEVNHVSDYAGAAARGEDSVGSILFQAPLIRAILQEGEGRSKGLNEIDRAVNKQPDLVTLWAGNNDILSAALGSEISDTSLTPFEDRKWQINTDEETPDYTDRVMPGLESSMIGPEGALSRLLNETDAHVMVMNVPDVTTIPHLLTVGERVGRLPYEVVLPNGEDITERLENFVIPSGVDSSEEVAREFFPHGTKIGLGSLLSKFFAIYRETGTEGMFQAMDEQSALFGEDDVLDPNELNTVQDHVDRFNKMLEDAANDPRVHLVDVNDLLLDAKLKGIKLQGEGPSVTVGAAYTGTQDEKGHEGIFSHDGVHPSDIGYAVVANLVLKVAKEELGENPRFDSLTQAEFVDEKAAFSADPHRLTKRAKMILGGLQLDRIRAGSPSV